MEFLAASEPQSIAEERVWRVIQRAFRDEDGFATYNLPLFGKTGVLSNIDAIVVHREWGLFAFEIKGYKIESIVGIDSSKWTLRNNLRDQQIINNPEEQLKKGIWRLYDSLRNNVSLDRLPTFTFIA